MNILLLGATGRVGRHVLQYALADGHAVTALVRTPEKIDSSSENMTLIQGNVLDQACLRMALHNIDIVISALSTDGTTTLSKSMPLLIEAMNEQQVERILTVGTAGILQSRHAPHLLRYQSNESKQRSTRAAKEHHQVYQLLAASNLNWTIVCPTYLPDKERLGSYRIERDFLPINGKEIAVADTAHFIYHLLDRTDFSQTRIGISY